MTTDLIRYDLLTQEALRGVVRKVLEDASKSGLPGDHHFYVSFDTVAPGVRISQRIREKYPEEMTIVLQHQFWDLIVTEQTFEVGLSFGGIPERLLVPFDALTGFFDPSVKFGVKFEPAHTLEDDDDADEETLVEVTATPRLAAVHSAEQDEVKPAKSRSSKAKKAEAAVENSTTDAEPKAQEDKAPVDNAGGAQVVSLDKFRKK